MKIIVHSAALLAALISVPAIAQPLTVVQNHRANVFGVVQAGPQVRPVDVTQTGQANVAGVVQAGAAPRSTIKQTGRSNTALVTQFESRVTSIRRSQMP
jgi:Curlin associated repeat